MSGAIEKSLLALKDDFICKRKGVSHEPRFSLKLGSRRSRQQLDNTEPRSARCLARRSRVCRDVESFTTTPLLGASFFKCMFFYLPGCSKLRQFRFFFSNRRLRTGIFLVFDILINWPLTF